MDVAGTWKEHLNPSFVKLLGVLGYGRVWNRAEGVWLWDDQGRRYLDALSGFGATAIGHNHPRLIQAIQHFFTESPLNLSHTGPAPHTAALAQALGNRMAPLSICLLANGGAEAVEAAIKLAVAATNRSEILYCQQGYHGTSIGTLAIMGASRLRAPFEPLLYKSTALPFGDLQAAQNALQKRQVAALIVEPIQAEGGVHIAPEGYLEELKRLCQAQGSLLILDEIQTGLGRTGPWVAPVVPDIRVLGKALGGGLIPVSVALTTPSLHQRAYGSMERFDLHSSTYGGGALGCAVALETLAILQELQPQVAAKGTYLLQQLQHGLQDHPFVRAIRGQGLLLGIELAPSKGLLASLAPGLGTQLSKQVLGQWLAVRLLEAGIVAQPAALSWDVLRLEPPLTIDTPELDLLAQTVITILNENRSITKMLADVTTRLGIQAWRGGSFR